jgi:hypothetical protein
MDMVVAPSVSGRTQMEHNIQSASACTDGPVASSRLIGREFAGVGLGQIGRWSGAWGGLVAWIPLHSLFVAATQFRATTAP